MALLTPLEGSAGAVKSLCIIYVIRTLSLLLLAFSATFLFPSFSPLGYDTSSTHITGDTTDPLTTGFVERLVTALTRWDAIYFASIARHGHRWEQEWAFGVGQSYLVHGVQWILGLLGADGMSPSFQILFLSIVSCGSHLVSAIILYHLTALLFNPAGPKGTLGNSGETPNVVAFIAATLHILSPAGIFLIAPYNESIFSVLSFLGYWFYSYAVKNTAPDGEHGAVNEVFLLLSGLAFGVSGLFRSNGIINGVLFVFEVSQSALRVLSGINPVANIRLFIISGVAGALVGLPMVWRQYLGWVEYCSLVEPAMQRDWCAKRLPSIYSFVQSHYWGVGFLKYWTPNNIPLFLLASPTLYVLFKTSAKIISIQPPELPTLYSLDLKHANKDLLFRLTLPQLLLAVMAVTSYHVQIIARLSSGLPMWYIVSAAGLVQTGGRPKDSAKSKDGEAGEDLKSEEAGWVRPAVKFFLGYQVVQAVLYGGFLPPA
ncbi:ER membrane glycoprotein subunit of the GPI transamidase complex-like protein [Arthrobotrys musiformis]|uniref:GPI mannosyltransferase 2 n=1 Tax=Arthrobotrys musiformis TaxID=47236 RepID=A0AAV9W7C5_9PEZI